MALKNNVKNERGVLGSAPGSVANLPNLTHNLDSVRVYNFEVQFNGLFALDSGGLGPAANAGGGGSDYNRSVSLAAKRVQSAGHSVEDIAVRRFNDLYHYPGAANSDELIITFDHLLLKSPVAVLYEWFRNGSYNVRTGVVNVANISKKHSIDVIYYDNARNVESITSYYGVFVSKFSPGEHNYATANEFHTFDVSFRYDFMEYLAVKAAKFDDNGNDAPGAGVLSKGVSFVPS